MPLSLHRALVLFVALAGAITSCAAGEQRAVDDSTAQAIFDRNCVKCHGPLEHKSGLELDTIEAALRGNEDGPVIAPGRPQASKLIAALSADADPHMPPKKQLSDEDIATLRIWIGSLKEVAGAAGTGQKSTPRMGAPIDLA